MTLLEGQTEAAGGRACELSSVGMTHQEEGHSLYCQNGEEVSFPSALSLLAKAILCCFLVLYLSGGWVYSLKLSR